MVDPKKSSSQPPVAESPVADVFENRQPTATERTWAEGTLAPTIEKTPENPIGAPTGADVDQSGRTRSRTISNVPTRRLSTSADLPPDWSEEKCLGYPGQPPFT